MDAAHPSLEAAIHKLVSALAATEEAAKGQAWAKERPWRCATHVWLEQGLEVVDLHDLSAKLARNAVRASLEVAPEAGARIFVVGRGRHSKGTPVLGHVVRKELTKACADRPEWGYRMLHASRWVHVTDRRLAPGWVQGQMGWGLRIWLGCIAVAAAVAVAKALGLLG